MNIDDIKIITPSVFKDHRGEIYTTFDQSDKNYNGIKFNHDKIATRVKNTLAGIHGDFKTTRILTCLYGSVINVLVDYRKESADYLKHKIFFLSDKNKQQLLVPPGFGNSFYALSDCVYNYKLSYDGNYIDVDEQFTLKWNDPKIGIKWDLWLVEYPILSDRDKNASLIE